jgi:hypothetical protein
MVQKELKSSKEIINILLKDMEIKDANLEKCIMASNSNQIYGTTRVGRKLWKV